MVVTAVETTGVSSATMKEATAARPSTQRACVMPRWTGAAHANRSMNSRTCDRLTGDDDADRRARPGRRRPGRRRARLPRAGRALPARARRPLLPHARLGARCRGRRAGDAAARVELARALRAPL